MYDEGLGVAQDHRQAQELFRKAAEQRYPPAMVNLGRMYTEAADVKRDDVHGYALIRAALDMGVPASMHEMAFYELGEATARLHPKELARAETLANELSASPSEHAAQSASPTGDLHQLAWRK
jgi:TPR repeat protein